jgi:hypothetical protein
LCSCCRIDDVVVAFDGFTVTGIPHILDSVVLTGLSLGTGLLGLHIADNTLVQVLLHLFYHYPIDYYNAGTELNSCSHGVIVVITKLTWLSNINKLVIRC